MGRKFFVEELKSWCHAYYCEVDEVVLLVSKAAGFGREIAEGRERDLGT